MLRIFVEWDGNPDHLNLLFKCSSCGTMIEDSDVAVALFPVKPQSREKLDGIPITELDWTTVYTVHAGPCAYRARNLALATYQQVEARQLSAFVAQLLKNTDAFGDTRPELWETIKRNMESDI